jgi:hypothetical protein
MIRCCMVLHALSLPTAGRPRSVRQLPISFPQGPSRPRMRPILRPCDRKPVAVTLLDSAFTKRHTRNSFRMCIYENCRGVPSFFPFWNSPNKVPLSSALGAARCGGSYHPHHSRACPVRNVGVTNLVSSPLTLFFSCASALLRHNGALATPLQSIVCALFPVE